MAERASSAGFAPDSVGRPQMSHPREVRDDEDDLPRIEQPPLVVVRHGQSTFNAEGRWQGHADPPLSDLGAQQARLAAERAGRVDRVVSSDLTRAARTAEIIAEALGCPDVVVVSALRERDVGWWSGRTREEVAEMVRADPTLEGFPDGYEHADRVAARALAALAGLACSYPGEHLLVVSHGGVIGALASAAGRPGGRVGHLAGLAIDVATEPPRFVREVRLLEISQAGPAGEGPQ